MANLRDLVHRVHATPGVVSTAVVGRDGLVIDAAGLDGAEADHVAALAPGLVAAAEMLADASASGTVRAVVVEGAERVLLAMPLSTEVTLLAVVAGGDVDAAHASASVGEALFALRRARRAYAELA
jgi:predicted regulator of Ras-like GTPase activity (Roadblock/LC7/MglB family)